MATRRQLRAGTAGTGPQIPERIARFDLADWPPTKEEPDMLTGYGGAARFCARRRWNRAQRAYAEACGISISELWHLISQA